LPAASIDADRLFESGTAMAADAATFQPVWDAESRWAAIVSPDNRLKAR